MRTKQLVNNIHHPLLSCQVLLSYRAAPIKGKRRAAAPLTGAPRYDLRQLSTARRAVLRSSHKGGFEMYDTTKSKFIDGRCVKYAPRPQDDIQENLYRAPNGDYFTATIDGSGRTLEVAPLTSSAARSWLALHSGEERAAEIFGAAPAEEPTDGIQLTLSISPAAAAEIAAAVASALASADAAPLLRGLRELVSHGV